MKKSALLLIILTLTFILLAVSTAHASEHYIRAGATGANSGSDWNNAWRNFSSVIWSRGDTYYIASGYYTSIVTLSIPDNSIWLHIRKATAGAHGTDAGWLDSYANGQAVLAGQMKLFYGHINVDGITGSGKTGHGIKIDGSGLSSAYPNSPIFISSGSSEVNLSHIEIVGVGQNSTYEQDGVYSNNIVDVSKHYYSYLYLHDIFRNGITWTHVDNSYIDHCYFQRVKSTIPAIHGQTIQLTIPPAHDNEIRYNTFEDTGGQGQVSFLGTDSAELYENFRIYGNIVFSNDRDSWVNDYFAGDLGTTGPRTKNILVYHNTFYNAYGVSTTFWNPNAYGNENRNNLYVNSYFWFIPKYQVSTNNFYFNNTGSYLYPNLNNESGRVDGIRSPFVNAPYDFHLIADSEAIDRGIALPPEYATDFDGLMRPQGAGWDIGAYEYETGTTFIQGDADRDGDVDLQDLLLVAAYIGRAGAMDLDSDGNINLNDLMIVVRNWGMIS